MTKKNEICPGNKLLVVNKPSNPTLLWLTKKPGGVLDGTVSNNVAKLAAGSVVVVVSPARKYQGINCVEVEWNGANWFAYYCDIRYITELV